MQVPSSQELRAWELFKCVEAVVPWIIKAGKMQMVPLQLTYCSQHAHWPFEFARQGRDLKIAPPPPPSTVYCYAHWAP